MVKFFSVQETEYFITDYVYEIFTFSSHQIFTIGGVPSDTITRC